MQTMSTTSTQHASGVGMILVMDSIPWVRCASGNVFYLSLCFCICVFGQPPASSAVEGSRLFYVEKVFCQ